MLMVSKIYQEICWSPREVKISKQSDFKLYLEKKEISPVFLKNLKTKGWSVSMQRENEAAHAPIQLKVQSNSRNKECKSRSKP